jgi:hypothetical protein
MENQKTRLIWLFITSVMSSLLGLLFTITIGVVSGGIVFVAIWLTFISTMSFIIWDVGMITLTDWYAIFRIGAVIGIIIWCWWFVEDGWNMVVEKVRKSVWKVDRKDESI